MTWRDVEHGRRTDGRTGRWTDGQTAAGHEASTLPLGIKLHSHTSSIHTSDPVQKTQLQAMHYRIAIYIIYIYIYSICISFRLFTGEKKAAL